MKGLKIDENEEAIYSAQETVDEGYSSRELPAETDGEKTEAEPAAEEAQAAEPSEDAVDWASLA